MVHWKPVVLNKDILSGEIDGLVGIEELGDYSIEDLSKGKSVSIRKRKSLSVGKVSAKKLKKQHESKEKLTKGDTSVIKTIERKNANNKLHKSKSNKSEKKKKKYNESDSKGKKKGNKKQKKLIDKQSDQDSQTCLTEVSENDVFSEMKSWENYQINFNILKALYEKKFFEPTTIQRMSLAPSILGKRDILGAAETGSGKTLAFGIPIVNGILELNEKEEEDSDDDLEDDEAESDWENNDEGVGCVKVVNLKQEPQTKVKNKRLQALVLTPTRELAVQVKSHLDHICKYTNVRTALIVGGLAQQKQERILKKRPEIVVATPGRLWELLSEGHPHLADIGKIKYLAIDETDRMLEKGHFEELEQLLEQLNFNEKNKARRQNFIFSATLTVVHAAPKYLKGKKRRRITGDQKLQSLITRVGVTNPKVVDLTSKNVIVKNIVEYKIICTHLEKDYYLYYFLKLYPGRTLVFANSISCVRRLANLLTLLNCRPLPLHANMEQRQRLKNLDRFRDEENSILLATDVAARGLDIPDVKHVVHFQVPMTAESYVHRSGRTARANNEGTTLIIMEPRENKNYLKILHTLGKKHDITDLPLELSLLEDIKTRVHLARDVDQLSLSAKKKTGERSWYEKAADAMDIIVDEDEMPVKLTDTASQRVKKDITIKKKQLKHLLSQPLIPKGFSGKYPAMNLHQPGTYVLKKL